MGDLQNYVVSLRDLRVFEETQKDHGKTDTFYCRVISSSKSLCPKLCKYYTLSAGFKENSTARGAAQQNDQSTLNCTVCFLQQQD